MTKFKISFIQFNNSDNERDNITVNDKESSDNISLYTEVDNEDIYESDLKVKNDYEFNAVSKQCRELIYIIIQYNAINIKIRNSKIFRAANYNTLSLEQKNGIIKLVGDLKILKEQNTIMLKNIKYLEYVNEELNEEYNTLEENYKITMDKINGRDPNYNTLNNNLNSSNNFDTNKSINFNEEDWKNKIDELKNNYNTLIEDKNNLELIEENNRNIEDLKIKNNLYEKELDSYNKNLSILNQDNIKMKKNCENLEKEVNDLKEKNKALILKINNIKEKNNEEIKKEINNIKKENENLNYENKNLKMQKNMLTNQKKDMMKDLERIKKERDSIIRNINNLKLKYNNKKINNEKKDKKIIEDLQKENNELQNEYDKIKEEYQYLILDNINLKDSYERIKKTPNPNKLNMSTISANTSMVGYQLSPEEYEEYDNLRKNKDEYEALILQLKSNNEALELEINELKEKIKKIKKRKKIS